MGSAITAVPISAVPASKKRASPSEVLATSKKKKAVRIDEPKARKKSFPPASEEVTDEDYTLGNFDSAARVEPKSALRMATQMGTDLIDECRGSPFFK